MAEKVFLKECYIQGTNRYEALDEDVWKNLKASTLLYLHASENKVYLIYKLKVGEETKEKKIGFLSEEDAKDIENYLKVGWSDKLYEAKISFKDENKSDENKRMKVVIFIKPTD